MNQNIDQLNYDMSKTDRRNHDDQREINLQRWEVDRLDERRKIYYRLLYCSPIFGITIWFVVGAVAAIVNILIPFNTDYIGITMIVSGLLTTFTCISVSIRQIFLINDRRKTIERSIIEKGGASLKAGPEFKSRIIPDTKNIFIIHGHDLTNALRLSTILEKQHKLNPIILSEVAGIGRTIIEKFEQEAVKSSYAFALMTPDDRVSNTESVVMQARPNVIFEIGWFYGRIGRMNISILFKRGTNIHSDLEGINRIEFIESVEEISIRIERELKAARLL